MMDSNAHSKCGEAGKIHSSDRHANALNDLAAVTKEKMNGNWVAAAFPVTADQ